MCKNANILDRDFGASWRFGLRLLFAALMMAITPAAKSVTLSWNSNTEPNVAGYNVYLGIQSGVYTNVQNAGNSTNILLNGLATGVRYYFAVTAYSTAGIESDYSSEVSYLVSAAGNNPPTLNAITNRTILEDAGIQTVGLSGISSGSTNETQTLTVVATSSNPGLIPNPTITYTSPAATGVLNFSSVSNAFGTATITVTVNDGQSLSNTFSRTFSVTVNPVNDGPTVSVATNQIFASKNSNTLVTGVSVLDVDAAAGNLLLHLSVQHGKLLLATNVIGGVSGSQVTSNNSPDVWIAAPLAQINATLANPNGVFYLGTLNFAGDDTLTITINDNGNTGTGGALSRTAQMTLTTIGDALDAWRAQFFSAADLADPTKESAVWGDGADPDGDGRDNLMEFALGLNPLKKDSSAGVLGISVVKAAGTKYASLTFNRRQNTPILQYIPEVSGDGQAWTGGTSVVKENSVTALGGSFESVVCQDLTQILPSSPRYFRLRVVKNIN
jgi:hypothetical protein